MRQRLGAATPMVIATFALVAGVIAVSVAPHAVESIITGDAIIVTEEVVVAEADAAVQAVAQTRDDVAKVAALIAAVRNANPVLCELAARGSWNGGWHGSGPLTPLQGRNSATMELVRFASSAPRGREVIQPLRAALGDPDPCVRRFVAPLLGRTQQDAAVETLVAALRDPGAVTREAAAVGLRFAEKPSTIDPLTRALEDPEAVVRAAAAWALGEIEDPAAIPALTAVLREDRDPEVRRMAAWALGNIE
ncbi:MAG: HEAT repeat domain-containing protein [Gemmatimonadaceae bacterium]